MSEIEDEFKNEAKKTLENFKAELMKRLEPVVQDLVANLRYKESESIGSGLEILDSMLAKGDVNKIMYDIIRPALDDLDTEFEFKLASTTINSNEPTKLG